MACGAFFVYVDHVVRRVARAKLRLLAIREAKRRSCGAAGVTARPHANIDHAFRAARTGPSFAAQPAVSMAKQARNSQGQLLPATGGGSCSNSGTAHDLRFHTETCSRCHEICTVAGDQHFRPRRARGGLHVCANENYRIIKSEFRSMETLALPNVGMLLVPVRLQRSK
ncbi:unnamed protein product, partial [Ectocarpus sp. 6 AP-2014]